MHFASLLEPFAFRCSAVEDREAWVDGAKCNFAVRSALQRPALPALRRGAKPRPRQFHGLAEALLEEFARRESGEVFADVDAAAGELEDFDALAAGFGAEDDAGWIMGSLAMCPLTG